MAERMTALAMAAAMLALSACGGGQKPDNAADTDNAVNAMNGAAPDNADNAVINAVDASANDFARYVGKYPFDKVNGQSWDSDPAVVAAITAAVPDREVRDWVLKGEGPTSPIKAEGGKILSWACEAHNCGPHNWTTIIDPKSATAEVCYYDDEATGGQTRWFSGGKEIARKDACPDG